MPYGDEQRNEDVMLIAHINQDFTNLDSTTIATYWTIKTPPVPCRLARLDAVYNTEAGTTPALTVTVARGTTALLSSAATTAATFVSDTSLDTASSTLECDASETLAVRLTDVNADNDFTGISIQLWAFRRNQ